MKRIDCFIPAADLNQVANTLSHLQPLDIIRNVFLLATDRQADFSSTGLPVIYTDNLNSSDTVAAIARAAKVQGTRFGSSRFDQLGQRRVG